MLDRIPEAVERIRALDGAIRVVSHFDTDGITSAAIFSRVLSRMGKQFSLQIVKSLDEEYVRALDGEVLIFLDLASNSLEYLKDKKEVYIFDHHHIEEENIPENVFVVNPVLGGEMMSGAGICYLFAREAGLENKDLAHLAVIGMVGDMFEKDIGKQFSEMIGDSEGIVKKGLLLYPSTRPLDRALEYSSSPYIPGVTGNRAGVLELLRNSDIRSVKGRFPALYELSDEEMRKLVTGIVLKSNGSEDGLIGNLFLVKFFSKLEDARELSALINACSRMDRPEVALGFCLGNAHMREEAEKIYITYKQNLFKALKFVDSAEKIEGKEYVIINTQDKIKDTIIGTVASILSHSPLYSEGSVIVTLGYVRGTHAVRSPEHSKAQGTQDLSSNEDKIKVSARIAGRKGRNVREVLSRVVVPLGGEVGGHPQAAGCLISREKEAEFVSELQRTLDIRVTKV